MPQDGIDRVHTLARLSKASQNLQFTWRNGTPIEDVAYDESDDKMIDGKQCTILWHVDDLKISHVKDEVIENVISTQSERYGKEAPLVVTRGKVHDYLRMTLDFSVKGKVKEVIMKDYIQDMLDELPSDMDGE
jgi:hypothetical protein